MIRWVAACVVAVTAACAVGSDAQKSGAGSTSDTPSALPASVLVLHAGGTTRAIGQVIAPKGAAVQFCPPDRAIAARADTGLSDLSCRPFGVTLINADLDRLADRRVSADGVTGYADVTGTYRNGTLTVTRQVAASAHVPRPVLFHDHVPCPAPDGGWPRGPQPSPDRAQAYASAHPDQVVEVALLNPSRSQSLVYVLTAGDPSTVERDLRAAYGQRLCVAASKYSIEQLRAARRLLDSMSKRRSSRFYEGGSGGLTSAEQPRITVSVAILAERDAQAIDDQPAGLWQLTVWLKPVTH